MSSFLVGAESDLGVPQRELVVNFGSREVRVLDV